MAAALALASADRLTAQASDSLASLPVADNDALRVCGLLPLSRIETADPEERVALTADATWFIMEQEKDTSVEAFMASVKERLRSDLASPDLPRILESIETLAPLCAQRWPFSQRSYPVALPVSQFDRAGICAMAGAMLSGMARNGRAPATYAAAQVVISHTTSILSEKALVKHGFKLRPGSTAIGSAWLKAGHRIGNLNTILTACSKA
ncbi:MAG: hypothetical protein ACKOQM_14980 [Novosphingobium sp.]